MRVQKKTRVNFGKARAFIWIGDAKTARKYLPEIQDALYAALDTEFPLTGPNAHMVQIWSLCTGPRQRYVIDGKLLDTVFRPWLEHPDTKIAYFNYKEDADMIEESYGINLDHTFIGDAMVMDWLVDETDKVHGLKHACEKWLGWYDRKTYKQMFAYVPDGKKTAVVVMPDQIMHGTLPDEILREYTREDYIERFKQYAADDAEQHYLLFRHHKKVLKKRGYWQTYRKIDRPFTLTLRALQNRGTLIDTKRLQSITRAVEIDMLRLRTAFKFNAGLPDDFNIQSRDQLKEFFFNELGWPTYDDLKTDTGDPQLNAAAYKRYAEDEGFELARIMQAYNKLKTTHGTFLVGMSDGIKYGPKASGGLLYSNFNQIGAESGRISSRKFDVMIPVPKVYKTRPDKIVWTKKKAGMNFQNIPNAFNDPLRIRSLFIAPPGYSYIVADYSGFELWMALYNCHKLGIKSKMLKALLAGKDVHSMTAKVMCNLPCHWSNVKELYQADRNGAGKKCNFNLLYGGQAKMLASILGWDTRDMNAVDDAQGYIDRWNTMWPEMPRYQQRMVEMAYDKGYVETISGRRRHLERQLNFKSKLSDPKEARRQEYRTRAHYENVAKNVPCQGSAADIMKVAQNLVENDKVLRKLKYEQKFPVHDEIVGICPTEVREEVLARVLHLMRLPFKDELPFDLVVEGSYADNWLDAK